MAYSNERTGLEMLPLLRLERPGTGPADCHGSIRNQAGVAGKTDIAGSSSISQLRHYPGVFSVSQGLM